VSTRTAAPAPGQARLADAHLPRHAPTAWRRRFSGLLFGGDYNPEQWPEDVWAEDAALMERLGVNLVSVGVFAWSRLEVAPGEFRFDWLDRVLDLLHGHGVLVDLATATASPPPWLSRAHPDVLPVLADGTRLWPGARQAYCPSHPAYRAAAARLVTALAERYADHPALAMWHVNNEYGGFLPRCYCDVSAVAFRRWLAQRYGSLDALNEAWSTSFWSQAYHNLDEVLPPRSAPRQPNPAQVLDFARFSCQELLDCYRLERDLLRRVTPDVPVTTNLMLPHHAGADYWRWVPEVDVVANGHYLSAESDEPEVGLALSADLARSLAGGAPWLLLEHSTGAVSWQPRNLAKRPGELRRNSLAHVARGSDGAMFFQWRASLGGAEKFHSAMLPHAGTRTRVFRELEDLAGDLHALAEVAGSRVEAQVAILWDWEAWWALELESRPTVDLRYLPAVERAHACLWRAGITTDLVHPEADLARYRLLLAPSLYLVGERAARNLAGFVQDGGTLVVGPFSGVVDEHDRVWPGGYPGALRTPLGVCIEEFQPLRAGERVSLSNGMCGSVWSDDLRLEGADAVASYVDGQLAGQPAITRHGFGEGVAWYVSTCLAGADLARLLGAVCEEAGVSPVAPGTQPGVELVRRRADGQSWLFVINHSQQAATVAASGLELLTSTPVSGALAVPAGAVRVVREPTTTREERP
jgi:beta-galactosidase